MLDILLFESHVATCREHTGITQVTSAPLSIVNQSSHISQALFSFKAPLYHNMDFSTREDVGSTLNLMHSLDGHLDSIGDNTKWKVATHTYNIAP